MAARDEVKTRYFALLYIALLSLALALFSAHTVASSSSYFSLHLALEPRENKLSRLVHIFPHARIRLCVLSL